MKRISLIIIAAVAFAFVACGSKQISTRVLCYNVHNCVGLDGELSCERIAKIINDADADAVAIQELDSMTTRHPGHDMLSELAELTGMHLVERLAGRVIDCPAEDIKLRPVLHDDEVRVPAGDNKPQIRRLQLRVLDVVRGDVPLDVIDAD